MIWPRPPPARPPWPKPPARPLYQRYLSEGLPGLNAPIQDLAVPDVGEGWLAAIGTTQAMVWKRDEAPQPWLVEPLPEDFPLPVYASMTGDVVGVLFLGKTDKSPFSVCAYDTSNRRLEGQVVVENAPAGLEFMGNAMTFYTAEADPNGVTANHRLAEYHRLEGESVFTLTRSVPLDLMPYTMAACPPNQWLAVCGTGASEKLQVWDLSPAAPVAVGTNQRLGDRDELAFSPDCRYLAVHPRSSDYIEVLGTADLAGQAVVRLLSAKLGQGAKLAFSPDGTLLAVAATIDQSILEDPSLTRIYDWQPQELLFEVRDGQHLKAMAFENDGRRLATGGQSGIVKLWDVEKILRDRQ